MIDLKKINLNLSLKKYSPCYRILLPKTIENKKIVTMKVLLRDKIEIQWLQKSCELILKSVVSCTPKVKREIEPTKSFRF